MFISEGECAVRREFGSVSKVSGVLDAPFSEWPSAPNFLQREAVVFKRYPEDSRNGPDGMVYEIWGPVFAT